MFANIEYPCRSLGYRNFVLDIYAQSDSMMDMVWVLLTVPKASSVMLLRKHPFTTSIANDGRMYGAKLIAEPQPTLAQARPGW